MSDCECYRDWISIYDDEIKTIYFNERLELRRVSALYFALQRELNRIKSSFSGEIDHLRSEFHRTSSPRKILSPIQQRRSDPLPVIKKDNLEIIAPIILPTQNDSEDIDKENEIVVIPRSPTINKNRNKIYMKKNCSSPSLIAKPFKVEPSPNYSECDNTTNLIDCSIEEPVHVQMPKKIINKSKIKKKRKAQNSTLTQMPWLTPKVNKKPIIKKTESELASMDIDQMLDYINQHSDPETTDIPPNNIILETQDYDDNKNLTADQLQVVDSKKPKLQEFIKNYDRFPEKVDKETKFEEVVRGREERRKLKGWSCKECEDFYKNMNLSPGVMNKCSKHRSKFGRDETFKGFWDLTFKATPPTPDTPKTEQSIVFNFRK